jgi:alpha 1,2-mannosyltransferase
VRRPGADFTCDIPRDPFTHLARANKTFGFVLAPTEFGETVPSLWAAVQDFMRAHPEHIAESNARRFVSEDGESYNMCHCACTPWRGGRKGG